MIAAIAVAVVLLAIGAASAPTRMMPGFALAFVDRRRSDLLFAGVTVMLSVCTGLLVVLALR